MKKSYATLLDVAQESGLSRAQVSRALRGDPGVRRETRELAQKAADKIGYKPNLVARSLASARGTNVGVVIGEPLNPFHMLLARQIDVALSERGYDGLVSLRAQNETSAVSEADRLLSLRVVGLILIATPDRDALINQIGSTAPTVYIGKHVEGGLVSTVGTDDDAAVGRAIAHLLSLGHQRIGLIDGASAPGARERREGYRRAMAQAGLTCMEASFAPTLDAGKNGIEVLMREKHPPTAILAHNDIVAMGAINGLKGLGIRVPEDVSVIGFDDIPYASSQSLSLTTLRQDTREQAQAAVTELLERLETQARGPQSLVIPASLQIRGSVMSLRQKDSPGV